MSGQLSMKAGMGALKRSHAGQLPSVEEAAIK